MNKMRPINNLEDLRNAKRELAVKQEITKQEFRKQMYVVRRDTGSYLLKKVLLPVGLGVAGAFALKYFFGDKNKSDSKDEEIPTKQNETIDHSNADQNKTSWVSYLSLLFSIYRVYQRMRAGKQERSDNGSPVRDEAEAMEDVSFSPKDFVAGYRQRAAVSEESS